MTRILIYVALLCVSLQATLATAASIDDNHQGVGGDTALAVNPVVQWNRNLPLIVRTPGAQPATVHATFAPLICR